MSARARTRRLIRTALAAACAVSLCARLPGARAARQTVPPPQVAQTIEQIRRAPPADDAYAQALALGYALLGEARYEEAARLFGALVERRRSDPRALYGDALATFNAGRAADAEPLARRAVEAALAASRAAAGGQAAEKEGKTRASDALVLLGVVLAVRGDDAGALKAVGQAAELAPESFDAQLALGRARFGAGDDAGAARAFRDAISLRPADAQARFFLATALEHAGDDAGALAAYRELVALRPGSAEGHMGLGVLLLKRGGAGADEGLKELARALEISPNLYEARVALGRALVERGRAQEAVEHLRRAAELAPGNPEPHYQLSIAYRRLGRKDEAAAEAEIVKRIHESRRGAPATPED